MGSMGCLGCGFMPHRAMGGNPDRLIGTAKCGPACLVVWDLWLAEVSSVSHGDPIGLLISVALFSSSASS